MCATDGPRGLMFNLDPSKLLVIAVVMIIVSGPERLPHFARQVGGAWRAFSEFRQRMESEVRKSCPISPPRPNSPATRGLRLLCSTAFLRHTSR